MNKEIFKSEKFCCTVYQCDECKKVSCKENDDAKEWIIKCLNEDGIVNVVNLYETFYGVGFDSWLKSSLSDLNVEIKATSWNKWEGYPWDYIITVKL